MIPEVTGGAVSSTTSSPCSLPTAPSREARSTFNGTTSHRRHGSGGPMSSAIQPRLHHLAITVTDLDASVRWYGSVFGLQPVLDLPHPGGLGRILAGPDGD